MNQDEKNKMDADFYRAYAKDRTLSRVKFNAEYEKKLKENAPKQVDLFASAPSAAHKKIYDKLRAYCDKFPTNEIPNIVLSGDTGSGKTFAVGLVAETLRAKGVWVEFVTAFSLYREFQNYMNTFGRDNEKINDFIKCDLLIIDDLGAEPTQKNLTNEHIYNIINERLTNKKPFIITSNLDGNGIGDRYDRRITSRILGDKISVGYKFPDADLRFS